MAKGREDAYSLPPMMFGLGAVIAPIFNALSVVFVDYFTPVFTPAYHISIDLVISLTGLVVGDLLGILVIAPFLVWLVEGVQRRKLVLPKPVGFGILIEDALVIATCVMLTVALWKSGMGAQPAPGLLAGAWIGLRHGRIIAWSAILVSVLVFLPYSAHDLDDGARLELHLAIAAVVLVTWLSGSFADAQKAARSKVNRRNRMLFQAERLKTLRAMSVAVIHEISQPLSTLAIEAGHLRSATENLDPDIAESAQLVDRKARALSDLVRRLRRFGGRDLDEPSNLPVQMLVQSATQIVTPELKASGCKIDCSAIGQDWAVQAQEIELTQALVNLLRNALIFSPGTTIALNVRKLGHEVSIHVCNPKLKLSSEQAQDAKSNGSGSSGMGVGLVIARTIVEAHGGTLVRRDEKDTVCFVINLPLIAGYYA